MALTQEQQAIELITRAKRILIAAKEHATVDTIATVIGVVAFLSAQKKSVDAIIPGYDPKTLPAFLPSLPQISDRVGAMRAFLLSLDVHATPLGELMYDVKDGKLEITVVPKKGEWTPKDITFKHGEDRYDLVIAIDAPDRASLGILARDHADFLYRTPVINIDRDPGNEHWGQINLVDLTAVSSSEVAFAICERWNRHLIDEVIATAFLAGMIAKTQSFRTANVTPKTLQIASQLIAMGAKREEIVHGLWRTRSVATLKLWGRALARLEQDRNIGLVWSALTKQDFVEAGSSPDVLDGVVNELVTYAPEAKIIVLIHENENAQQGACVTIHANAPYAAMEIGRAFGATGTRDRVDFCLAPGQSIVDGTKMVIDRIRETVQAK